MVNVLPIKIQLRDHIQETFLITPLELLASLDVILVSVIVY